MPPTKRLNERRVLVVDNDEDARDLLCFILGNEGATAFSADCVESAMETIRKNPIDLVISDIGMPGEDGFSLILKLNEMNQGLDKKIPAIALTGHARPGDRVKVLSMGYKVHLAKPVEPEELVLTILNFSK
ncbi:MAG: response regulator [Pyrinomonadaceae bacterium]|nr:response regulator [Pyrinomonadaceae bacterium]